MCLSEETIKTIGSSYLGSMPGGSKIYHTKGEYVTCRGPRVVVSISSPLKLLPRRAHERHRAGRTYGSNAVAVF